LAGLYNMAFLTLVGVVFIAAAVRWSRYFVPAVWWRQSPSPACNM
jgi:hypothetical protein